MIAVALSAIACVLAFRSDSNRYVHLISVARQAR
jgi:hypothetical protein